MSIGVHEEGEVLEVIVAIVQQDIEAGSQKEFVLCRIVAQEGCGEAEKKRVFVSRDSEVGMEQASCRVHVNAPLPAGTVKPLRSEEVPRLRFDKAVWCDSRSRFCSQFGINEFEGSGVFPLRPRVELDDPGRKAFCTLCIWRKHVTRGRVEKDVDLRSCAARTARRTS